MTAQYVAIVEKDPDSAFGVWFPDIEGCFSAGETLAEAAANAAVALRQHAESLESAGRTVPPARPLDAVRVDTDVREALTAGAVLIAVPLLSDAGRTVRINVSLDKGLVDQIDDAAAARGLTRSAFLAQAAREKIAGL
ncbi:type II toxin-antitoxin system HicB family antitoxin [Rhodoplanes serenus]|uniref:type II toxin-antitoxin system HicB family antitoxin n=1 Tax=Rhodoplanes serenus TaxID=200615 RepID=UPI000DAEEA2D|nr:type II toxin-antitoxin system HicB family antitoxin [Rhodoplanes serenus]RAI36104.1 CopG family transcriptional regulator [Rhodoplanes serenus]